jgi:hypothetical protein
MDSSISATANLNIGKGLVVVAVVVPTGGGWIGAILVEKAGQRLPQATLHGAIAAEISTIGEKAILLTPLPGESQKGRAVILQAHGEPCHAAR